MIDNKLDFYIHVGLVVLAALAINEMAKYYIEQQMKFNEGKNVYYLGYAFIAVLLVLVVNKFMKK